MMAELDAIRDCMFLASLGAHEVITHSYASARMGGAQSDLQTMRILT